MEKNIANDTLGANIRRLRKEKGLTQDELAKAALTTRYNILRYESGKMTLPRDYRIS